MAKKAAKSTADMPSSYAEEDKKYKVEDALRTLTRAEEIRSDRDLMKDVEACRQDKMRQLANIKVEVSPKTIKGPK